jgi:iron complex transport system permease protein
MAVLNPRLLEDAPCIGQRARRRSRGLGVLLLLASAALLLLGLAVGSTGFEPVWDQFGDPVAAQIVRDIRLPRTLGAFAAGGLLGLAGALAQGLFRNPLADPFLLGSASGASLGVALALVALGVSPYAAEWSVRLGLTGAAFVGAVGAVLLTLLLARGVQHTLRLLLAGVVVGVVLGALASLVTVTRPEVLQALQVFTLGSTAFVGWTACVLMLGVLLVCAVPAWAMARVLDALVLGESTARSLGLPLQPLRLALVALLALATGTAVAQTGLIAFVGLAAPHLVRAVVKTPHARLVLLSALMGGVLLMAADTLARAALAPQELPVGVLTALLGGGYLLWKMSPPAPLRVFPPKGGRTLWPGKAGSTGALDGTLRAGEDGQSPAPLRVFPPKGGRTLWPGKAGSTGALDGTLRAGEDGQSPAPLRVFPPTGGRTLWPGRAGSTGALDGTLRAGEDGQSPAPLRVFPPTGGPTLWPGRAGSTGALDGTLRAGEDGQSPAPLRVFPPTGGRTLWPGRAGSTGALDGTVCAETDCEPPAPYRVCAREVNHTARVAGLASCAALQTRGLAASLGQGGQRRQVIDGLDLAIAPGRWTCIVGPNGAGKSTLLRALAGLLPVQGEVLLAGQPLRALSDRERARRLAWLGQASADTAADDLTVYDVALLGRLPHMGWLAAPSPADHAATERALRQTQAWDWRDRPLGALSGGERQRVLLARLLAVQGQVLLMDEPLANLDPPHQADWLQTVQALVAQGCTVVSVLHELNMVLQADDLVVLEAGRLRHAGPGGEAAAHRALETVFQHRIAVRALGDQWVALPR